MSQPTPYDRYTNFGEEQALAPTAPLRAIAVDAELDRVKQTTDGILNNLSQIQRDDGEIANGTIGVEQLKPSLSIGFTLRGPWAPATNYSLADGVTYDSAFYKALASHLSVAGVTPDLVPAVWEQVVNFSDLAPGYIPDASITEAKLAALAVTEGKIADVAVTTGKIADVAVTTGKIADLSVTTGKIADLSVTAGKIAASAVTNAKLANMATLTLKGNATGGAAAPTDLTAAQLRDSFFPAGSVVNSAFHAYTTNAAIVTLIPLDDTIPQSTEGTLINTAAITPSRTANKIRGSFSAMGATDTANVSMIAAVFRSGSTNAIAVAAITATSSLQFYQIVLHFEDSPATTSPVTYTVRVGPSANGMRLNGLPAGRYFGGAAAATLTLQEVRG